MAVPVPLSRAYVLLLLSLPGVWLLGRAIAFAITRDRGLRAVLPIGVSLTAWILGVHVASLAARSLPVGLPVGTLVLAAAGVAAEVVRRRRAAPEAEVGEAPSRWLWISTAATAAFMAPSALRFWFHDELMPTGHFSIVGELQNGVYPPRHLAFADYPLRYHYGFDLISGSLTAMLHLPIDRAIDAAAILLWCASWCLLWGLGEQLLGRARAWLTPLLGLFAGGVPLGCEVPGPSFVYRLVAECRIGSRFSANAPVPSYFFQHPWSVGIPVAITAVLILGERAPRSARARIAALTVVLGVLSLCEIVLFVTLVPSLVVAEAWYERRIEIRRLPPALLAGALAFGIARLLGGFFLTVPGLGHIDFVIHAGFTNDARTSIVWDAQTFGVLPVLGLAGFFVLRRARVLFGLLALGSLLLVNAVRYVGTEDIMKFATVAELSLGILSSAAVARVLPRPLPYRPRRSPLRAAAALVLAAAASAWGVLFLAVFALDLRTIPAALRKGPEMLVPADVQVVTFLRSRIRPGEVVYRDQPASLGYAHWGGLAGPWLNWMDWAFGMPPAKLRAREALLKTNPPDPAPYRAEGLHWFVLAPNDRALIHVVDGWIAQGIAREAGTFGPLRVVELDPR